MADSLAPSQAPSASPGSVERSEALSALMEELILDLRALRVLQEYYASKRRYPQQLQALVDADKPTRIARINGIHENFRNKNFWEEGFVENFGSWLGDFYRLPIESIEKVMRALPLFRDITPEELDIG